MGARVWRRRSRGFTARSRPDLEALRDDLARRYFEQTVDIPVCWGRETHGRRSMTFGSYDFRHQRIRIHPRLAQPDVPGYFVEAVLFHEMLHHVLGYERSRGRRVLHSRRFRDWESRYEHAEQARHWQTENLPRLLGRQPVRRRRRPRWIQALLGF